MFFDGWHALLRVAVVGAATYAWLILVLRVAGKRSLSKLNAFGFAITVAFGSVLASVLLSKDVSLAEGALAIGVLAILQFSMASLSVRWPPFRRLVQSEPRLLVDNGVVDKAALAAERITQSDVDAAIRMHRIARMADVGAVVLETDGSFSVIRRGEGQIEMLRSVRRFKH